MCVPLGVTDDVICMTHGLGCEARYLCIHYLHDALTLSHQQKVQ